MKEKIYEFNIEHPLTAPRRKAIDHYLKKNASKSTWPASHKWDEENDHLLHITTYPVTWEVWFAPHRVTVFGNGPFWAKMLFSDKKRAMLREGLLHVLQDAGFMKSKAASKPAKSAKTSRD
jgi:hypothetical protein